jgi:CcmD family protein
MPALPLHEAGKYVAAAYIVFFVLVLVYVSIMALRLSRIERELGELLTIVEQPPAEEEAAVNQGSEQDQPEHRGAGVT